ncbi:MAG: hypothetical protein NHB14_27250 [Desulfosporosinus sp.]|nr:hypothetical protein [Desulfosporosinus sp.]
MKSNGKSYFGIFLHRQRLKAKNLPDSRVHVTAKGFKDALFLVGEIERAKEGHKTIFN